MNYIVLDMEWNQPFNMKRVVKKTVTLRGEIIQIGAVKLDEDYQILDTFKIMVLPKYYTKMNKEVSKLTGITTEDLQYGFPFPIAFKHFKKWCGEKFCFLTWGEEDVAMLRSNMILHGMNTKWIPRTYDIQLIFDDQITKEGREVSLLYAMEKTGESALEAHDALNDARNAVAICLHLDMVRGLSEYDELKMRIKRYRKKRSNSTMIYPTMELALNDPKLPKIFCPVCGSSADCADFVRQNSNKFICISKCENGDELFARFTFAVRTDGQLGVARNICEMDENNMSYYINTKKQGEEAGTLCCGALRDCVLSQ